MRQKDERTQQIFVSYASADRIWAEWLVWQLEEYSFSVVPLDQGLRVDRDFEIEASKILNEGVHILAIFSPDYLFMLYSQLGWALLLHQEVRKKHSLVIPVHVRECKSALKSLMGKIDLIDLSTQHNEQDAQAILIKGIAQERFYPEKQEQIVIPRTDSTEGIVLKKQLTFLKRHGTNVAPWEENIAGLNVDSPLLKNIPYERHTPYFIDRDLILDRLHQGLKTHRPQALVGLGGIGKTEIALEYAKRYAESYDYLFWANAISREALITSFLKLADLLRLDERNSPNQREVVQAVKNWLQNAENWLLVLDDVKEPAELETFLPIDSSGHLLLTTQLQTLGALAQSIAVDGLSPDDGAKLLLERTHTTLHTSSTERTLARRVSEEMDGVPLALDQAGAYMEEMRLTLEEYQKHYSLSRKEILDRRGNSAFSHPASVETTWRLSFQEVEKISSDAIELLDFCAFLRNEAVPEELLTEGSALLDPTHSLVTKNIFQLNKAFAVLRRFSLINRDIEHKTFSTHKLVKDVLRDTMTEKEQRMWAERVVRVVNGSFPNGIYEHWDKCQRYVDYALACVPLIQHWQMNFPEATRLLHQTASYLDGRGRYMEAQPLYKLALELRQQIDDPNIAANYKDLAWNYRTQADYEEAMRLLTGIFDLKIQQSFRDSTQTLNDIAWVHYNQGEYERAETIYKVVLEQREAELEDPEDPDIATSLNNLAWIYSVRGKYKEAESLYLRALSIREHRLRPGHPYIATSLDNLAKLYRILDRYDEAEALYTRALRLRETALGAKHTDVALSLGGLGLLYYARGEYERAKEHYDRALSIREQALGKEHPHVARVRANLARLYRMLGRYEKAEQEYQHALTIQETRLGREHPDVAQTINNYAHLCRTLARFEEAEQFYQRALAIRSKAFGGEHHPEVAGTLNDLGRLYLAQGRYEDSEKLYLKTRGIREELLGKDHLDVAQTLNNMARLYRYLGRYVEAEQLGQRAYDIWKAKLGPTHHYLATILNNLGQVHQGRKHYDIAEVLFEQAWNVQIKTLGENHPNIVITLNNRAHIAMLKARFSEAEALLTRALEIRRAALGEKHPYLAYSLDILSQVQSKQGNYSFAATLLDQAVALRERGLGVDHPEIAVSLYLHAQLHYQLEEYTEAERLYLSVLSIRERKLGADHLDVALTLHQLGKLYASQHNYLKAEGMYQRAIAIYEHRQELGETDIIATLEDYAEVLRQMDQEDKAMTITAKAQGLQLTLYYPRGNDIEG